MRFSSCSFLCLLCQLARRSGEARIGMGISMSMPDGRSENKKRMNGWVGWKMGGVEEGFPLVTFKLEWKFSAAD